MNVPCWRRGFIDADEQPCLHGSTYEAGDILLQRSPELGALSARQLVKKGYKAQCALVLPELETLLTQWSACAESAVVEGVHLLPKTVAAWVQRYPSLLPFLVRRSCDRPKAAC